MIAVHDSDSHFTIRWKKYLEENGLQYILVDCFADDIIYRLTGVKILLWHWHHSDFTACLFARQLIYSIQKMGVVVFPDFDTCWHFDDKIGQKYLFEALDLPLVPSKVFYRKEDAVKWLSSTEFPVVHKTRTGAGASNVTLIRNYNDGLKKIRKAFGKGFNAIDIPNQLKFRFLDFKKKPSVKNLLRVVRVLLYYIRPSLVNGESNRERGYFYIQEFIPNNKFDIRIIVIGKKAIAIKRYVRENDFRASGSGNIEYEFEPPLECLKLAFDTHSKLNSQCTAFDFIFDTNGKPLIVEICYAFSAPAYDKCPGYWDPELKFYPGPVNLQGVMIEHLLESSQ